MVEGLCRYLTPEVEVRADQTDASEASTISPLDSSNARYAADRDPDFLTSQRVRDACAASETEAESVERGCRNELALRAR
jgi:hypothetical protein